uniref:Uncharacterized protein n=1 Tax=Fagus sylvatica TaxID=28930 RepID=A0A2N9HS00_FAGSY
MPTLDLLPWHKLWTLSLVIQRSWIWTMKYHLMFQPSNWKVLEDYSWCFSFHCACGSTKSSTLQLLPMPTLDLLQWHKLWTLSLVIQRSWIWTMKHHLMFQPSNWKVLEDYSWCFSFHCACGSTKSSTLQLLPMPTLDLLPWHKLWTLSLVIQRSWIWTMKYYLMFQPSNWKVLEDYSWCFSFHCACGSTKSSTLQLLPMPTLDLLPWHKLWTLSLVIQRSWIWTMKHHLMFQPSNWKVLEDYSWCFSFHCACGSTKSSTLQLLPMPTLDLLPWHKL